MSSPFSLTLANPSRVLSLAADLLSPLRVLAILVWPAALLAAIAGYFNWYDLSRNLELALSTFTFLQNLLVSMLTANLLSRLVMGVTMAAQGIPPQEFGIRLLFGVIPRFYVSTAQIRQLDFPQQRRCYAAPLLTRLGLFAIGVLTWVLLRRGGTGAADAALVLGATGLGAFLFTLNPIWRADGYHWMAAWFRMPDLREQSYRLLGLILRRKQIPEMLSARAIRGLLFYALASIVFTAVLISLILSSVAYGLEQQYRGAGVIMFALILSMMLAFLISRRNRKGGKSRREKPRSVARASHRATVSCYKPATHETGEAEPGSPEQMARNTARKTKRDSGDVNPAQSADLDAILPASTGGTEAGDAPGQSDRDPELEAILGAPGKPAPKNEFDEILDAALNPAPKAGEAPVASPPSPPTKEPEKPAKTGQSPARPKVSDNLDNVLRIGKAKRTKGSTLRKLLVWAVLLAGLYYVAIQPYPFTVGGDFIVQPVERTQVRARTEGEIVELNITEGDWVEQSQVMAVLSNWDEERDIAIIEADLARLRADLETLTAGPKPEEIALAEQELKAAETKVTQARQELERKQQLFESNTVSQKALEDAQGGYDLAVAEREQAAARLELLNAPTLDSEIAAARASIERKQQELTFGKLQLEHTNIRAPASGQVVSTMENVSVGMFLREGDLFAELADNRTVMAEIEVPETEIDEAAIGAEVTLKSWSSPDESISGTVKRTAPVAEEREFGRVVRVIVEVPNPDGRLSRNMTGFGKIIVDERPVWEVFTRVFVRFFRIEIWSWLP